MRHARTVSLRVVLALVFSLSFASLAHANGFNKEEFAARRAKLFEQIAEGVAVVFADEQHVHAVKFGLSVHDVSPPEPDAPLQAGVVFNVEPLLEFRDKKIHMRLEDSVLVTATGAENLTAGVPADIESLYALIKQKGISTN